MAELDILALGAKEKQNKQEALLICEEINILKYLEAKVSNLEEALKTNSLATVIFSDELNETECDFLENLYMSRPKMAFILICQSMNAGLLSKAMHLGITKVITEEEGAELIRKGILDEVRRTQSRKDISDLYEKDSKVISVFSTKGGSGKTTVAVNLAVALRQSGKDVVILDFDLQFGDVGVFLNLPRCDTISDLAAEKNQAAAHVQSFLFTHESGLKVLCAPTSPELAELVKPQHIQRIVDALRKEYDYIIIDLSPLLDDNTITALECSDKIYFVTNPEIPTLKNTRTCMGILKSLRFDEKIQLILNREGDPYVSKNDVKRSLDMEPVLCIPNEQKTASSAINRGIPAVIASPKSKLAKAIIDFAENEIEVNIGDEEEKKSIFKLKLG